ncbi:hypothetical protein H4Q26_004702 [Puccinia striiformis f. sp. tritici PST-130]|nr:hypothetical protein H4Q26_004702 [Puccinia striiformis f. sp. tritici PST-130]
MANNHSQPRVFVIPSPENLIDQLLFITSSNQLSDRCELIVLFVTSAEASPGSKGVERPESRDIIILLVLEYTKYVLRILLLTPSRANLWQASPVGETRRQ